MSATEALRAAHAAGVRITVDGDDLLLTAPSEPPATVLDLLSQHKPAIGQISTTTDPELVGRGLAGVL
jgi:hypothetical protein